MKRIIKFTIFSLISLFSLGSLAISSKKSTVNAQNNTDYVTIHFEQEDISTNITLEAKGVITPNIEYSYDLLNWNTVDFEISNAIPVNFMKDVYLRGNNPNGLGGSYGGFSIKCDEAHSISGDLSTLISYTEQITSISNMSYAFCRLFQQNSGLVDASQLKIDFTEVADDAFYYCFEGCNNLEVGPRALPATTLGDGSYEAMFANCIKLVSGPALLPALEIPIAAYDSMFSGCTNLDIVPRIDASIISTMGMSSMFENCAKITEVPYFVASDFGHYACREMFSGCSLLKSFPEIKIDYIYDNALEGMFSKCSSLLEAKITFADDVKPAVDCFKDMFNSALSLKYLEVNFTGWTFQENGRTNRFTNNWLYDVSSSGYIICPSSLTGTGNSYIPNGWTKVDGLYKITFDKNGGQGDDMDYVKVPVQTEGFDYILPTCPFVIKESTPALGWAYGPYDDPFSANSINIKGDLTLYAIYYIYTYSDITYTWDGNNCTAAKVCNEDDNLSTYETKQANYVKDSDATCDANEFGHYEVSFENELFTSQVTPKNSVEIANTILAHIYDDPVYTWNGSSCTATRVCKNFDTHIETETIEAIYIKDVDATCGHNEFGHYEATFTNEAFSKQVTENSSLEIANSILPHNFASPVYAFIDETTCKATRVCLDNPSHYEEEIVTATYVKDVDATCLTNEFGHYEFIFENQAFKTQSTEANSLEIENSAMGHKYFLPIYNWSNGGCVAIKVCVNDPSHIITEIVNGTLIIDTPATCTTNALGHYEANFENESFTTQVTEANSYEVLDTATGHHYTKVDFSWNEDFTKCFASAICDCGHQEEFVSDAIFVKDSNATCSTNIKGHQEASFELFETQKTPENSIELGNTKILEHFLDRWVEGIPATHLENGSLGHYECKYCHKCFDINGNELESLEIAKLENHNFEDITYSYDSDTNKVVATATCECNETISETVDAKIMGQYVVAEFENDIFTTQYYPYENGNNNNNKERKGLPIYVYIGGGLMLAVIGVLLVFLKKKKTISI